MPKIRKHIQIHGEQGEELASRLYDYKLSRLVRLNNEDKAALLAEFRSISPKELDMLLEQVIAYKRYEAERIGWQAIPHDITVLVFTLVTFTWGLKVGVTAGIAALVLLESIFQFYFYRKLYPALSTLVWFTYPAYALLAYALYRQGYAWLVIAGVVAAAWVGTFLLGTLARIPVRMIKDALEKARAEAITRSLPPEG